MSALLLAGCSASRSSSDLCSATFATSRWAVAAAVCPEPRATLARARALNMSGRPTEAVALLEPLLDADDPHVAFDARYLVGHFEGSRNDIDEDDAAVAAREERARALLWQALLGHRLAGRHSEASRVAATLSHLPRPFRHFDDALFFARIAEAEAEHSGDLVALGLAKTAVAEVEDEIGLTYLAQEKFIEAAGLLANHPAELAYTYTNHGLQLLELDDPAALRDALRYLDAAGAAEAQAQLDAAARHDAEFARSLNRVDAHLKLGDLEAAERALTVAPVDRDDESSVALVRGYLAARRGQLELAEQEFAAARLGPNEHDYRMRVGLELAEAYRRAGRLGEAEQSYRQAVAAVEQLRSSGEPELRVAVLERRARPYRGLLSLLAAQGRGRDALVVGESLHARTMLDVVLGAPDRDDEVGSLQRARVQQRADASPALDAEALWARIGAREAIVVLSDGTSTWRAHVHDQQVELTALSADDLAALARFMKTPDDPVVGARAGAALLPPGLSSGDQALYIVATGALADLPFAALRHQDRFLVESRPVVRLPGLAVLGCRAPRRPWTDDRHFLGDARGDLEQAAAEVRRLGGTGARLQGRATRAAVAGARTAALLHIAVHGRLTPSGGALEMADGLLTPAAIVEQEIAPRVVVLTGCATAASRDSEAWGGFPSAFLAAGSQHVVATLNTVDDAEAAEFARAYYETSDDLSPVDRLTAAQRALIAADRPVATWAAFTVWGDADCGKP